MNDRDRWIYESKLESLANDLSNARETLRALTKELEEARAEAAEWRQLYHDSQMSSYPHTTGGTK